MTERIATLSELTREECQLGRIPEAERTPEQQRRLLEIFAEQKRLMTDEEP